MLPRVTPETQYDRNGQLHVRYTGTWATRTLGILPEVPYPATYLDKHEEPKYSYRTTTGFLFLAIFAFCCALTIASLGIFHWATPSDGIYAPETASQLTMTGLATSVVTGLAVVAFWPEKRGRISKRLFIVLSIPALYMLLQTIANISAGVSILALGNLTVDGFYIAELVLMVFIGFFIPVALYPASESCILFEKQRHAGIRAISLILNTVVGAIVVIYLCFAIYSVHDALSMRFSPVISTISIATTSMLLVITLGAYYAVGSGIRAYMIPYMVVGVVALIIFLENTAPYVRWLNGDGVKHDYHDTAYVAMFALNCLSILGMAIMVGLSVAFAFL